MAIEKSKRAAYTLEYKLKAVRLFQGGHACAVTAKVLGHPQADIGELGKTVGEGQADWRWHQAGEPGTDGAGATKG